MQPGDEQFIVGSNFLWEWRLRRCLWNKLRPRFWRSVLNDLLPRAREEHDRSVAIRTNLLNVWPARQQAANIFEDGSPVRSYEQLRFFEWLRNAHTNSEFSVDLLHIERGKLVGVSRRADLLNRIPELAPAPRLIWVK